MSLSLILPVLSVVAIAVTLLQALAKSEPGKPQWKKVVVLAIALFCVNVAAEISKAIVNRRHEMAEKQRTAQQYAANQELIADVRSLNQTAAEAFERLNRTVSLLPRETAEALMEEGQSLKAQVKSVTQASLSDTQDEAAIARLKRLIEDTHSRLQHFATAVETEPQRSPASTAAASERPSGIRPSTSPTPAPAVNSARTSVTEASSTSASQLVAVTLMPQDRQQPAIPARDSVVPLLLENSGFTPSGFMGDAAREGVITVDLHSQDGCHSSPDCQKWTYLPARGNERWAAVAWQFPKGNWGDQPGKDWSTRGFTQVSIWARGTSNLRGRLPRVQFKAGGTTDPTKKYKASFEVDGDFVTLTTDWTRYSLDLRGKNLSQVIAAFVFVLRAADHDDTETTFYLDNIEYR